MGRAVVRCHILLVGYHSGGVGVIYEPVPLGRRGVHVTTGSCSSSAACEDRTLSESVDRVVNETPFVFYIMCGWPTFLKYGDHGTCRSSPQMYAN